MRFCLITRIPINLGFRSWCCGDKRIGGTTERWVDGEKIVIPDGYDNEYCRKCGRKQ